MNTAADMNAVPLRVGVLYPREWNGDFDADLDRLRAIGPRVEVLAASYSEPQESRSGRGVPPYDHLRDLAPELTAEHLSVFGQIDCCIAIDLPFDVRSIAPNLRWVQGVGAGIAQLWSAGLEDAGIRLTNGSGVTSTAIAEFVMARILGEFKQVRLLDERQQQARWEPVFGQEIAGKTLGLIGLGPINEAVAARARAFGLRVVALRRSGAPSDLVDDVVGPDALHDMLGQSNIVVAAVPESPETDRMMDAAAFAAMRTGAMFVNVGRGTLVDEDALVDTLEARHLRAAAIDVARIEPLAPTSRLWTAPNLYISAHCSTDPTSLFRNLHRLFEDNVRRFLDGEPLRNEVRP
jgi:phosphoglycerate dehydrogenase-like enzyme